MITGTPLPRGRGLVVAAVGLGLPVIAHLAAVGSASIPLVAALPLALLATLCVTASSKSWTVFRLTVALTGLGVASHAAMWAGHSGQTAASAAPLTPHHSVGASPAAEPALAHGLGLTPSMVGAHVAAMVLSIILLRHGETLLLWLATLARRLLAPGSGIVVLPDLTYREVPCQARALPSYRGACWSGRAPPQLGSI